MLKLVEESTNPQTAKAISASLTELGLTFSDQPKLWEGISRSLISLKEDNLSSGAFKDVLDNLAKAGYRDENYWKEIKKLIVDNKHKFDA